MQILMWKNFCNVTICLLSDERKSPRSKAKVRAIITSGFISGIELGSESTHLFCNRFVYDFCIDFCGADIGVAQHSRDNLQRYAVCECKARKGMTGDMHCQRFFYVAYSGNLSEIGIHALI